MWKRSADLTLIASLHGAACAWAAFDSTSYAQHFGPRAAAPHTILLGSFASATPWETLYLSSTVLGLGGDLQRELGRVGFVVLYAVAGLASSVCSMLTRRSALGSGGAMATLTYHVLSAPGARHSVWGVDLGAKQALEVQVAIGLLPLCDETRGRVGYLFALFVPVVLACTIAWLNGRVTL